MKTIIVSILIVLGCVAIVAGVLHFKSNPPAAMVEKPATVPEIQPTIFHAPIADFVMATDVREYQSIRQKTLKSHPDLAAEYRDILRAMDDQQKQLDQAMVESDPKVAPVIAKLEAIRRASIPNNSISH